MGFPNEGLLRLPRVLRAGASQVCARREHRQERCDSGRAAVDDYLECFRIVAPHADYVAINVSSPNTKVCGSWRRPTSCSRS